MVYFPPFWVLFPLVFFLGVCQYIDMVCYYCQGKTQIINSRLQKRSNRVWRRRRCTVCNSIFTTEEIPDYKQIWVVSDKDGHITPFMQNRLFLSLYKSCQHRNNPIEDATALADTVIELIAKDQTRPDINISQIKNTCLIALNRFDKAAFTHYQAFHK